MIILIKRVFDEGVFKYWFKYPDGSISCTHSPYYLTQGEALSLAYQMARDKARVSR